MFFSIYLLINKIIKREVMMSYANYLYIAIRAAVDAGKSIMDIYNDPDSNFGIERKAANSP